MRFRSTTSNDTPVSFKEAVLRCLPPGGGLYVPTAVPDMRQFFLHMDDKTSYPELVATVAPSLLEGELNPLSASRVAASAFDFEPELKTLDGQFSVLSLCRGPTGVFKDFGVAFLAALLEELLRHPAASGEGALIISAARGETGATMARAFHGRRGLTSVLLYPEGVIRGLDPRTFVPRGGDVLPLQVRGSFDDCQRLVTDLINDRSFSDRYHVTSANTINPGRLLPQAFYFLYAFVQAKKRLTGDLVFSVPSGNFGNLISGLYAWKFGMPVNGFVAAMNANNAVGGFIRGREKFRPRPLIVTNSPALDVTQPSNYERLAAFYEESPLVMRNMVFPAATSDAETLAAMRLAWDTYGLLLDPHTAVALAAARDFAASTDYAGAHLVVLATGHPARAAEIVEKATGQRVELPEKLAALAQPVAPVAVLDPQLDALEGAIASVVS